MLKHILFAAAAIGALAAPVHAQTKMTVDADRLVETVRTLASDTFEGRAPGTRGEERTLGYLIARLEALGLEPAGPDGQWLQKVPLLHTKLQAPRTLDFATPGGTVAPKLAEDIYLSTIRPEDAARVANAPLVFVGYGVKAPERGWDDFKGADLKGKVAVFLINDPDFIAKPGEPAAGKFGDRTMTYYGRWTYKFEEAARQGAVAALIVHNAAGVGYGWNVVISPGGENYDIVRAPDALTSVRLQGWLSADMSARLAIARVGKVRHLVAKLALPPAEHMDIGKAALADGCGGGSLGIAWQAEQHGTATEPAQHLGLADLVQDGKPGFLCLDSGDLVGIGLPLAPFSNHVIGGRIDDLAHDARAAIGRVDILAGLGSVDVAIGRARVAGAPHAGQCTGQPIGEAADHTHGLTMGLARHAPYGRRL